MPDTTKAKPRVIKPDLDDAQKAYEKLADHSLLPRVPVMLRLDGRAFHTLTATAKMQRPFDVRFRDCMVAACKALVADIHGCTLAYSQSDEITVLLYENGDPWFNFRIQKMVSVAASLASVHFYREFLAAFPDAVDVTLPHFDARAWQLPEAEVVNCFVWRQEDAFKNCVNGAVYWALAKKYGKAKAFRMGHGLDSKELQELVFTECGINCDKLPVWQKRGFCVFRQASFARIEDVVPADKLAMLLAKGHVKAGQQVERNEVVVDLEPPRFSQMPGYVSGRWPKVHGPNMR